MASFLKKKDCKKISKNYFARIVHTDFIVRAGQSNDVGLNFYINFI